ncbi:hypothetical protein [Dyadobacter sp. CY356]|uniref:hypothetical protein n=1 Tax=Dyadobacter sp. CY356 TaxID=2906442 RepID=UPI001F33D683|nr:hypothetical protein [Dyadobacter sp. CY356]MCF0055875.1 hypothetical protein [Dyadobacter sp. CY356]
MYTYLLFFHSIFRWLVLVSLLFALFKGVRGWSGKLSFTKRDDRVRHMTATISHVQLTLGYLLYFNSPFIAYFRSNYHEAVKHFDFMFFGMIHITLMTISIILITIGSSIAKRQQNNESKFKTMVIYFGIALLIIFLAIPWPFSPLANRPYLRLF